MASRTKSSRAPSPSSGDPGAAGTANVSAVTTRNALTLAAASGGSCALSTLAAYTMTATETITHVSVWDNVSAGSFLFSAALSVAKGVNNGDTLTITTSTVSTVTGDVTTAANASTALAAIDTALDTITTSRATYGAAINRFQFAIQNLQVTGENQNAARGRIMDADFAQETANLSRSQILQQAGTAMVAQANQLPQQVLQLLR